jgi:FkbM family methyltransferase
MSWSRRVQPADFVRQMLWRYAGGMPRALRRPSWTIGVRCPPPTGDIRLQVRDNRGADLFIYSEVFEHEYYALPLTEPPSTILDLGANIGLTAIYFARAFPSARIACVEPAADNVRLLRRNLDMNGVRAAVFEAAAHVEDGRVTMERDAKDYGHRLAETGDPAGEWFDVEAISVSAILERVGWKRIGLAKIDIEGHETTLFSERCEWLDRVDVICLEYHAEGAEPHLADVANRHGFLPPRLLPTGLWFLSR